MRMVVSVLVQPENTEGFGEKLVHVFVSSVLYSMPIFKPFDIPYHVHPADDRRQCQPAHHDEEQDGQEGFDHDYNLSFCSARS